jgi:DNA helicase-2/ATP-dependent DNA helicase PcrA
MKIVTQGRWLSAIKKELGKIPRGLVTTFQTDGGDTQTASTFLFKDGQVVSVSVYSRHPEMGWDISRPQYGYGGTFKLTTDPNERSTDEYQVVYVEPKKPRVKKTKKVVAKYPINLVESLTGRNKMEGYEGAKQILHYKTVSDTKEIYNRISNLWNEQHDLVPIINLIKELLVEYAQWQYKDLSLTEKDVMLQLPTWKAHGRDFYQVDDAYSSRPIDALIDVPLSDVPSTREEWQEILNYLIKNKNNTEKRRRLFSIWKSFFRKDNKFKIDTGKRLFDNPSRTDLVGRFLQSASLRFEKDLKRHGALPSNRKLNELYKITFDEPKKQLEKLPSKGDKPMEKVECLIMAFNASIAEELADRLSKLSKYDSFTPSSYQQQLISFVMTGTGNGIVQAVAGSGKTTTIMQAMNKLRQTYGSKSKPTVNEEALTSDYGGITFKSGTTHSICNRASAESMPHTVYAQKTMHLIKGGYNKKVWVERDGKKRQITLPNVSGFTERIEAFVHKACLDIGEVATVKRVNRKTGKSYEKNSDLAYLSISRFNNVVKALVSTMKNCGVGIFPNRPMVAETAQEIYDYYYQYPFVKKKQLEVWEKIEEHVFPIAIEVLEQSSKMTGFWDFDDMFYMPALYDTNFKKYDFVFLDECQDTNLVTQKLIERMLKPNGRVVAVGDVAQAIYAFRGADANAMDEFKSRFNATTIPLSTCYRCGSHIIQVTNEIYNEYDKTYPYTQIKPLDDAPRGLVNHYPIGLDEMTKEMAQEMFNNQTGVICRKNAPLMGLVVKLFTWGIPANFLGRSEIGKSIINLVAFRLDVMSRGYVYDMNNKSMSFRKVANPTIEQFLHLEDIIFEHQIKAMEDNEAIDKMQKLDNDNKAVIYLLDLMKDKGHRYVTVEKVTDIVNELFSEAVDGQSVTLCTVHRSKGLEFHRAIILDFMESYNLQIVPPTHSHLYLQETNMTYVAFTRAERELVFLDSVTQE